MKFGIFLSILEICLLAVLGQGSNALNGINLIQTHQDISVRVTNVKKSSDGYGVSYCYTLPNSRESIDFSPRGIYFVADGNLIGNVNSSLDKFIFQGENQQISSAEAITQEGMEEWKSPGHPIQRCDIASFKSFQKVSHLTFMIQGFNFFISETTTCQDYVLAARNFSIPAEVVCQTASDSSVSFYVATHVNHPQSSQPPRVVPVIKKVSDGFTADEAWQKLIDAMTEYRAGPWAFDINLAGLEIH